MIPAALGHIGVGLGLAGAAATAFVLGAALVTKRLDRARQALLWLAVMCVGVLLAVAAMEIAILSDNFTVAYVARNSTTTTPLIYKVATLWGALEGSILLWAFVLCGYVATAAWSFRNRITDPLLAWALLVMALVCVFFFALLIGPADPFATLSQAPLEGNGLNPLLRNHPLMVIHPVMLYLGYVGFTVPFGFAIAVLVTGRVNERWLTDTRRWTMLAWGCLSVGILLGAWWSYEVLGWGGYWAWDPVENASLLPWLTATAFIHSLVVQERRGVLGAWNLSLLTATFALTIFGTFLTRSGVLESVHEFSESPLGPALLAFFAVIVAVSVGLVAWRGDRLTGSSRPAGGLSTTSSANSPTISSTIDSPLSREGTFLANNLLFTGAAFVVLLGTVFPLLIEAWNGDKLAVGRPYFDRMLAPVGIGLLAMMALSPTLQWRQTSGGLLARRALGPAGIGAITMVVAVVAGAHGFWHVLALGFAGAVIGSALRHLVFAVSRQGWRGLTGRSGGGMVAHIGVGLIAFGFIASSAFDAEGEFTLAVGETATVAGHEVRFLSMSDELEGGNRVVRAEFDVVGRGVHAPAVTRFATFGQPISTPSVATGLVDDVYLSLVAIPESGSSEVSVRVLIKPLVLWMWVGGGVLALGVFAALLGSRGSRRSRANSLGSNTSSRNGRGPNAAEVAGTSASAAPRAAAAKAPKAAPTEAAPVT